LEVSTGRDDIIAAAAERAQKSGRLRATVIVALAVYASALGGSLLLDLRAPILDGVPFCLGAAIFLCFYTPPGPRTARLAEGLQAALIILALGLSLACLSYLCAAANLPLRDREMIWIDRHLGFDWLQVVSSLDTYPWILMVFDGAYATFTGQLVVTVLVLLVAKRRRDLDRFFITFVCASLIAEIASVLVPTLGPMPVLADHVKFVHLPTLGRTTADIVLALRQSTLKTIDLAAVDGIISFPSLHAAVAVLVPFALRWNRPLFWPVAMLNALMLVSAIPSGNHYLIDMIGGVAVAGLGILCGRSLQEWLEKRLEATKQRRLRLGAGSPRPAAAFAGVPGRLGREIEQPVPAHDGAGAHAVRARLGWIDRDLEQLGPALRDDLPIERREDAGARAAGGAQHRLQYLPAIIGREHIEHAAELHLHISLPAAHAEFPIEQIAELHPAARAGRARPRQPAL
jgi:membrane-associated phospholipid phosphatase